MRGRLFSAGLCWLVAGCAGHPLQPVAFAPIDVSQVQEPAYLPPNAQLLQRVTVERCYNQVIHEPPSDQDMLAELTAKSAAIGGNILWRVTYLSTGILSRCSMAGGKIATAIAYRGSW